MIALILAGGDLTVTNRVLERVRDASPVIAADGGARHAEAIGRVPDVWVGDFDSSSPELERQFADVPRETHPMDKSQVDTELALTAARARGATSAIVLGAFGGRFDHTLAMALIAVKHTLEGFPVSLESGFEAAWPLTPAQKLELPLKPNQTFSLLALTSTATVSATGARWPLERAELGFGVGWGVSNQALGPATTNPVRISLERGAGLVVVQYGDEQ